MTLIEVRIPPGDAKDHWILKEAFLRIGYPFSLVTEWRRGLLKIAYGRHGYGEDLTIRTADPTWEEIKVPHVTELEGYLIAHLPGKLLPMIRQNNHINIDIVGIGSYFLTGRAKKLELSLEFEEIKKIQKLFLKPLFDEACKALRKIIDNQLGKKGHSDKFQEACKNNVLISAITHDVDFLRLGGLNDFVRKLRTIRLCDNRVNICSSLRSELIALIRYGLKGIPSRIEDCVCILNKYNIKSSFFVYAGHPSFPINPTYKLNDNFTFGSKKLKFYNVLKQLAIDGFEIGLHASTTASSCFFDLQDETQNLNSIGLEHRIKSIRHHRLKFEPQTWSRQNKCGFYVDSTLGFNHLYGFLAGTAFPFKVFDPETRQPSELVEVPVNIQDVFLRKNLPWSRNGGDDPIISLHQGIKKTLGGVITSIWHPESFVSAHGNILLKYFEDTIIRQNNDNYQFLTVSQVAGYWNRRHSELNSL